MPDALADRRTAVQRQIPLIVTEHYVHVVWVDAWPGDEAEDVAASWIEEPYDIGNLDPKDALDAWRDVEWDATSPHLREPLIGPYLPDNCWSRDEEERLALFRRNTQHMTRVIPMRDASQASGTTAPAQIGAPNDASTASPTSTNTPSALRGKVKS